MQAMYDLVGDKIHEIFDAQVVDIGVYDFENRTSSLPYAIERGVRLPDEPVPFSPVTRYCNPNGPVLVNGCLGLRTRAGPGLAQVEREGGTMVSCR